MSTAELKQLVESIAIFQQETDRQMKETDRKIKELGKQIGGLGNTFGAFAEGLAFSSIERILRVEFGMEAVTPRFSVIKGGEGQEFITKSTLAYLATWR